MYIKLVLVGVFTAAIIFGAAMVTKKPNNLPSIVQKVSNKIVPIVSDNSDTLAEADFHSDFEDLVEDIKKVNGNYGLYIRQLSTNTAYTYNSESTFWAASLYKLVVGGAVYDLIDRNMLNENKVYSYEQVDYQGGTGQIAYSAAGTTYTVEELVNLLFKQSDNIAQNILVRNISINQVINYYNKIAPDSKGKLVSEQLASPREIAVLLVNMYNNDGWSDDLKNSLFNKMLDSAFENYIPAGLNENLVFSHKIGTAPEGIRHDCGIVFDLKMENPTVVCLMSRGTTEKDFIEVSQKVAEFVNSLYIR